MTSSPTTRNRFEKIGPGEQLNTWGGPNGLNRVIDLVDASLDGWVTISSTTATLTSVNYAADQARLRAIKYTGSTTGTITIPSVEKWYFVYAVSADAVITTGGGTTATVKAGERRFVICDASNCYAERFYYFNGDRVQNIATPTASDDAATKLYVDQQAFAATNLPGINAGTSGMTVTNNGTAAYWDWGGYQGRVAISSGPRTVALADRDKWLETTAAANFVMSAATTLQSKFDVILSNAHTTAITVGVSGADTIDGRSSITLAPGDRVRIVGDGVSAFSILSYANKNAGPQVYLRDEKATGTDGGSASATTWQTRTLNTSVRDTIGVSLSSNQFTLPVGTWLIQARAPARIVNGHRLRLTNVTDTTYSYGQTSDAASGGSAQTSAPLTATVTISSSKTFKLEHYTVGAQATNGLGRAVNDGSSEIYAEVEITRLWP